MDHLPGYRDLKLIIADAGLKPITVVRNWTSLKAELHKNEAGSGQFSAPISARLLDLATAPGNRVHLYHLGEYFCGGDIEVVVQDEPAKSDGVLTVNWATDLAKLAGRLVAPDPTKELDNQSATVSYKVAGVGETVLRDLVNKNAGPGSISSRQIPHLVLGDVNSPAVGNSVTVTAPLSTGLMDQLRDVASAAGGLSFDIVLQNNASTGAPELAFKVFPRRDVSGVVRYSKGLGNLKSLTFTRNSPTVTVAVVGEESTTDADGNAVAGTSIIRSDSDAVTKWGRVEQWVSSTAESTDGVPDSAAMQQDGDLALLSGSESVEIDSDVVDTPKRRYKANYLINDLVGIHPAIGSPISEPVTGVTLDADPKGGANVVPTIGTGDPQNGKDLIDYVLQLQRRIARLEAGR